MGRQLGHPNRGVQVKRGTWEWQKGCRGLKEVCDPVGRQDSPHIAAARIRERPEDNPGAFFLEPTEHGLNAIEERARRLIDQLHVQRVKGPAKLLAAGVVRLTYASRGRGNGGQGLWPSCEGHASPVAWNAIRRAVVSLVAA